VNYSTYIIVLNLTHKFLNFPFRGRDSNSANECYLACNNVVMEGTDVNEIRYWTPMWKAKTQGGAWIVFQPGPRLFSLRFFVIFFCIPPRKCRSQSLPFTSLPIHCSLMILWADVIQSKLLTASLNKLQKLKLSLCLINYTTRYEGIWGSGGITPPFLSTALDEDEW
jgi:hypothetical protein